MEHEIEQEIKILDIDESALVEKINEVGGKKRLETLMTIYSYDISDHKLSLNGLSDETRSVVECAFEYFKENGSLIKNNAHLRLRSLSHAPDKAEFTLKYDADSGDSNDVKAAHEYTCRMTEKDAIKLRDQLKTVGLVAVAEHEKKRISYVLQNGCICDIDTYPSIPTYVELEGTSATINEAIGQLGLSNHKRSLASGREFFAKYGIDYYSELFFKKEG